MSAAPDPVWSQACLAAALVALDPVGTGIVVRGRAGPVREAWLARLRALLPEAVPVTRLPCGITDDALLGGLDWPATLRTGRPVAQGGLLARSHGGVTVVPMAERLAPGQAARIAQALDTGTVAVARDGIAIRHPARFGLVLLDEGEGEDEAVPASLADRTAIRLDLDAIPSRACAATPPPDLAEARAARPIVPDEAAETLCAVAARLGVASLRAPLLALRVARLHAGLSGRDIVGDPDLAAAVALVLAPRACTWPTEPAPPPDECPTEPPDGDEAGPAGPESTEDRILAAAAASLPPGLLARLVAGERPRGRAPGAGHSGATAAAQRGRPVGARPGDPRRGRLALIETLRAAAPWQRLRRGIGEATDGDMGMGGARLRITADDLRIRRLVQRRETTTIFAVDASGSAALERMAEAKGAVEALLAECYVRRDRVALVAFRGQAADLLLAPTRSLVRAKRALAALPGGGGTPLAAGIEAAGQLAAAERRGGRSPVVLLLTDGRANIARSGRPGRAQAAADALAAARALAAEGTRALVIDTAARPQDAARALAAAMAAGYLAMPQADAARLTRAVREAAPAR